MEHIPWFAWIAIAGIFAWVIVTSATTFAGRHKNLDKVIEQNTAVNEKLMERLEAIDSRLGAVEKTLNDIP